MTIQRVFLISLLSLIVVTVLWFVFLYQPANDKLSQLQRDYSQLNQKLKHAQKAQLDLRNIQKRVEKSEKNLQVVRSKFVKRDQLSRVANTLRKKARRFQIEIKDFAPTIESYFGQDLENRIKPLPVEIVMMGSYIQIGKFIEDWEELDFFILPVEISIEKRTKTKNVLTAFVLSNLYIWNE